MSFVAGADSDWSVVDASHVADKLGVDLATGVSTQTAARRLTEIGANDLQATANVAERGAQGSGWLWAGRHQAPTSNSTPKK